MYVVRVLQAYDVDLYINGHDHCLQDIKSKDRSVLVRLLTAS